MEPFNLKYADERAKTLRLSIIPKPEWEDKIRWFKKWCADNCLTVSDVLFEKVVETEKQYRKPKGIAS